MASPITSRRNPRIEAVARLRDRKGRVAAGRIIIDGLREISRALGGGVTICEAYHVRAAGEGDSPASALLRRLAESGAELVEASPPVFEKIAYGQRHEGVVAVAVPPRRSLADLQPPPAPIVAVLEEVEKPGNIGAVLRSADAAGVAAVIAADPRADFYNPNAIRASLGTVFTTPVVAAEAADVFAWLQSRRIPIFAARVDAREPYFSADYRGGAAFVLGAESRGLSDYWREPEVAAVRLPMLGAADSLNVSAAAAVLFYEALRQRAHNS